MTMLPKPVDVGNGLVCASFGQNGVWLSLASVDPEAGFVELTGLPLFAPEWRRDDVAVRRYRSWMRRDEHAFLHVDAGRAQISSRQDAPRGSLGVVQRLVIRASFRDRPAGIRIRLNGRLARPAYPEISEVDPPSEAGPKSRLKTREGTLRVTGAGAPIIVQVWLRKGSDISMGSRAATEDRADMRVPWKVLRRQMPTAVAWIDWPEDADEVYLDIACTFDRPEPERPEWLTTGRLSPPADERPAPGRGRSARQAARLSTRPLRVPTRLLKPLRRMNQRAATYARSCTALRVAPGERCILTDHRILPLSWTRDAYWQARLLLATWARGGHDDDARIVADHLRWLFLRCERPDGRWVRSHHADGSRKDHPFQADQQLYPLLELADFLTQTDSLPDLPPDRSWPDLVAEAWAAADDAIDDATGLLATEENAADDAVDDPFLLSNQILLAWVAERLALVAPRLGLARPALEARAAAAREAVGQHFVVDGPLGRMWAYSVNGRGGFQRYMDANDLPVAMAPLWGFCRPDDRTWRTTMRFAFDEANPGFVAGVSGGLGSRHTPGTWPLGDIWRWVAFGLMGDQATADGALERLVEVAFSDGMLPEAYDPDGTGSAVRHWFAWPGAALGALLLDHAARPSGD